MIRFFQPSDLSALHNLLSSNNWPYHDIQKPDEDFIASKSEEYFLNNSVKTIVYVDENNHISGYIRFYGIEDLDTDSPLFDIRVSEFSRGKGIGTQLVKEGLKLIFNHYKNIRRVEANTREDNIIMQRLLENIGFTQEARYRKCAKLLDGTYVDIFGYAILREEFKSLP